jgi:ABC-type multidrug transport system permease subunit
MTALPIVERELRTASRQAGTYWTRLGAAGLAVLTAASVVLMMHSLRGTMPVAAGTMVFSVLKYLSFGFACLAGVFLTADCLSEEKREGTLGLLFLTDLHGWDVVLGKLLATSLRAAYGLLGILPVLAVAFLLGGVTGGEFWRLVLVLGNTLLLSLALGLLVSSVSRDPQRALTGTMLLSACLVLVLPGLDWWIADFDPVKWAPRFSRLSPTGAFQEIGSARPGIFWSCLGLTHALAWLFFVLASYVAPRSWQDKPARDATAGKPRAGWKRWVAPKPRPEWRQRLLIQNPVCWLAGRHPWGARVLRVLALAGAGLFAVALGVMPGKESAMGLGIAITWPLVLAFEIWLASQASRFFVEATRQGVLELVLVTPVSIEEILRGHWWALRRTFLFPGLILLSLTTVAGVVQIMVFYQSWSNAGPTGGGGEFLASQIVSQVGGLATFVTGNLALACFGTWMGLVERKAHVALIKTFLFVRVLPWVALTFVQALFMFGLAVVAMGRLGSLPMWVGSALPSLLAVAIHLGFMRVSLRKVHLNAREYVAGTHFGRRAGRSPWMSTNRISESPSGI